MKKINLFVVIVLAMLFTGCAFNKTPFQAYPVMTEIQLNQANYRIIGEARGYSRQIYIFGIGGLSQKSLKENAISDMYANAHLTGSQAIINITTSLSVSGVLIFYISKRATAYGTIIEFIDDTNTSPSSPKEIVSDIKNEKTKEVFKNFESKQDSVAIAEANKCYIAWLVKTGHIKQGRIKELRQMYDFTELKMLVDKYSASELQEKSKGYDRKLRRFIAR